MTAITVTYFAAIDGNQLTMACANAKDAIAEAAEIFARVNRPVGILYRCSDSERTHYMYTVTSETNVEAAQLAFGR